MESRRLLLFPFGKLAVAAVLMSFAALPVCAQQGTGGDALDDRGVELAASSATPFALPSAMALAPAMTIPAESKKIGRTVDSKYLFLFGLAAALTVTDIELTQRCLQAGSCHEANILYGNNPTRARMYAFNLPVLGSQAVLSAWLKRRHPERNLWMTPPIADSVAHGIGTITGVTK
jgi:hypothetical protein